MKTLLHPRLLGLLLIFLFATQSNYAQDVIHCWDFNTPTGVVSDQYPSEINTANRVSGNGTISHILNTTSKFIGSLTNACSGSAPGDAFSVQRSTLGTDGNTGKTVDFKFSSEGYENLTFSFWSRRTLNGFDNNQIQYSVDGTNFTTVDSYSPPNSTSGQLFSYDLSTISTDVNDESQLVIRITFGYTDGNIGSATGNNRIDNVKLEGDFLYDDDSVVLEPGTQSPSKTITAADVTDPTQSEEIFKFKIQDPGTNDNLDTDVSQMRFVPGPNNTASWSTTLKDVIIKDAGGVEISGTSTISDTEVIFTPATAVKVTDGAILDFSADIVLETTGIIDQSNIQFQVEGDNSGFTALPSGSAFGSSFVDVIGNLMTIDVVASDIAFLQEPTDVNLFAIMQPDVQVEFVDVNGNRDLDIIDAVSISSSGDLDGDPVSVTANDGVATFSNLVHSTAGTNLALTATTADPYSALSVFFDVIANDQTSEVVATDPINEVPSTTITANNSTTLGAGEPVFSFDISDSGSGDGLSTIVNQMRFVPGTGNTANWSTTLQEVIVNDNSGQRIQGSYSISDTEIIFTPASPVVVADNSTSNFSVDIVLNETGIIDQSVIQLQVDGTDSGFTADFSGSLFSSLFSDGDVEGNEITIDVIASQLAFLQQPTDVEVNAFIAPAVRVGYVDENGNVDTSITTDITLTSSGGNLVNPLGSFPAVEGVVTFPNIGYSAEATGLTLTAETAQTLISPNSITSVPFDVGRPVIAIQDFDNNQPEWLYTTSIPAFDDGWGTDYFGVINSDDALPLSSGSFINNIFGENDLNSSNGTSGFASLNFVTVDVSGFTDVELSFDWEVVGYNVSEDEIEYQVFHDGILQPRVDLFTGSELTSDGSGNELIEIPNTVSEVSFRYYIKNDGAEGYSGLDNVKLTGNSNARDTDIIEPVVAGQVPAGTLVADVNDELAEAVEVFSFEVVDSGNFDNLPTNITRLRFVPGTNNTANWAEVIEGISISDGSVNSLDLVKTDANLTITPTEIIVDITSDPDDVFVVGDANSQAYTLSLFLNQTDIIDQKVIQFAIASGNENQLASNDGSIFSNNITGFEGNEFLIDVVGNGLEFIVQPTNTLINENMFPIVRVANTDANGNLDLASVGVGVEVASSGTLTGDPITKTITAEGYANFNPLVHTALGFDLTLTASANGFTGITSDEFDITYESNLLISEIAATDGNTQVIRDNSRFVELFNMSVEPINFNEKSYFLHNATSGFSVELTGTLAPKSYYIISFADATAFEDLYGVTTDLVSTEVVSSNGIDSYYLSIQNSRASLVDVHGVPDESGGKPLWEYTAGRFYRNIPNVRNSNPVYDEAGEWIKEQVIATADATPGVGDNDFVYSNDTDGWIPVGIGESPEGSSGGLNDDKSIFVENGTVTLTDDNLISDVVVRAGGTLILNKAITLNGDFANFGKVIFRSTVKETAALGPFDGNNRKLVGNNFEIERYIPKNNRAYRYLAPSVTTSLSPKATINANWQEGQNNTQTGDGNNSNTLNGFGTHITGSTTGENGFDATLTGNPSMFEWNASNQQWNSIPNTDLKGFNVGEAYAILIRGSRETTLNSNTAVGPSTTLRTTGRLAVGSRSAPNLSSTVGEFSLIGNPYQAKVDMGTLLTSGNSAGLSSQYVYIYDPTLGSVGGYATVDLGDGSATPVGSDANQFLDPNQAFFVETVSATSTPIVFFRESYKSTDVANNATFRTSGELTNLNINLYYDELETKSVDAVKVKFREGGNNAKDTLDATKIWNYEESFAINRHPNYMSIETRDMPKAEDNVPLYFGNSTRSNYRLEIKPENFTGTKAYLYDRYLETSTELSSDVTTSVSFELDKSIPASRATDRFVIKFEEVSLSDDDFELNSSIAVYPNPVRGESFSISHQQAFNGNEVSLKLFDLQGRLVLDQKIDNAPRVEVNVGSDLSAGVYILSLSDGKASQSVKLIVE
ncbi:T9SS type A sorting domain-containing protein [Psychroflexus salinarum]|uniref:T9SS type A sorting domain-containing protein n=1 Tax=Psychroflexus salinarum TaxID=546024 RepID=A0ABW3GPJ3_9FLAO